ncbi:MAG TPA: ABC transporter permease [Alphaproteobacteria bacterium]|nr:ABC transporter permease [Alphaproteobacteria bacterium]
MLRLQARAEPSQTMRYLSPLIAVALTLIGGLVIFFALGRDPIAGFQVFFLNPLKDGYSIAELFLKATPLMLIAIGLAVGFRANVWNIGAEGQFSLGAVFGGGLALAFPDAPAIVLFPAMMAAGVLGGMTLAAIPAYLRTRFNANEILTSLMLSYVMQFALIYLVTGPLRDPQGYGFPQSALFSDSAAAPILIEDTRVHLGVLFAVLAAVGGWIVLERSVSGFALRVFGQAPRAARFAGFEEKRLVWIALLVSGGLSGLAGLFEVAGPIGQLLPKLSPGYGFTAIIVAFLGRLHPLGVVPAALVLGLSYLGGDAAQIDLGLPSAVTGIFQGVLLFFLLACDVLILYRVRIVRRGAAKAA